MNPCSSPTETPVSRLLPRLTGVRQTAPDRWIAKCPAHDDRGPSLSLRELPDGKLLVHCFGGCAAGDVVQAAGLGLAALFPTAQAHHHDARRRPPRVPAADLLLLASREIMVAAIVAADFLEKRAISEADWQRLAQCAARLGQCADEVRR